MGILIIENIGSKKIPQFKIYPVPASDYVNITNASELKQVTIVDMFGKEIRTIINNKAGILEIGIGNIKRGVYIVRLIDRVGNISSKTLLIE